MKQADYFYKVFRPFMTACEAEIYQFGCKIPFPIFEPSDIKGLLEEATAHLKSQGPLLEIEPPVRVVGDIHGNFFDLMRIINPVLKESSTKLLLLGDYVDRGQYSLEVVLLLYTLILTYPQRVYILRGNHEFVGVHTPAGLQVDLKHLYSDESLLSSFYDSFAFMPIAAIIGKEIFCVHGGLSPQLCSLNDIRRLQFPITTFETELITDLMWSDPCRSIGEFLDSTRGLGKLYGKLVVLRFLQANGLKYMIRAHQCVEEGVGVYFDCLFTVFSSSFYNDDENPAGLLTIDQDNEIFIDALNPFLGVRRINAVFEKAKKRPIPIPKNSTSPLALKQSAKFIRLGHPDLNPKVQQKRRSSLSLAHSLATNITNSTNDVGDVMMNVKFDSKLAPGSLKLRRNTFNSNVRSSPDVVLPPLKG